MYSLPPTPPQRSGPRVPLAYLNLVNQIFEIEKKEELLGIDSSIPRNIKKLKDILEVDLFKDAYTDSNHIVGLVYHSPLGEKYDETRTDCEASIAGEITEDLIIIEVIKPIIYYQLGGPVDVNKVIVQKAVVVVQNRNL